MAHSDFNKDKLIQLLMGDKSIDNKITQYLELIKDKFSEIERAYIFGSYPNMP